MITCADIENLDNTSRYHENIWKWITLSGKVEGMETPRRIKTGTKDKVCHALLRDPTGVTNLTIWGEDVDRITNGCEIKIENGMVNEYQGLKRFHTGLFGTLQDLTVGIMNSSRRFSNMPTPTVAVRNY